LAAQPLIFGAELNEPGPEQPRVSRHHLFLCAVVILSCSGRTARGAGADPLGTHSAVGGSAQTVRRPLWTGALSFAESLIGFYRCA
jgi:hypothetical protein